ARALPQARHGRCHDRGDGGARSRPLSPRRARPRRPRRLSARARSPRAARTACRARHRADLGHVAPHGRPPRHARLALGVPRAACAEDYRAGRTTDLAHDEETRASGQKITCPLLAIWGAAAGIPAEAGGPLATWREWAINVRGFALDCGHYLAEEALDATAKALLEFFTLDR